MNKTLTEQLLMPTVFKGFTIKHEQGVVTIERNGVPAEFFDSWLNDALALLRFFNRSYPGTDWGCDGIGYAIQRDLQQVRVCRSGVGPRKFLQGLKALKEKLAAESAA